MAKRLQPRSSRDYEVGKGRPPKASRWKPGQSGNLRGRPKGSKNAASLASAELNRKVTATINGRKRQMTVSQIAYRRLADKAMAGDQKAFGFLLTLANHIDSTESAATQPSSTEQDLKIIDEYYGRAFKQ